MESCTRYLQSGYITKRAPSDKINISAHVLKRQNKKPMMSVIPVQTKQMFSRHLNQLLRPINKQEYKPYGKKKTCNIEIQKLKLKLVLYLILNHNSIWNFQFQARFCNNSHVPLIVGKRSGNAKINTIHRSFRQ